MSDFLEHLAGRTMGTIPVVAPRLPMRFEPADVSDRAPPPDNLSASAAPSSVSARTGMEQTSTRSHAHAVRSIASNRSELPPRAASPSLPANPISVRRSPSEPAVPITPAARLPTTPAHVLAPSVLADRAPPLSTTRPARMTSRRPASAAPRVAPASAAPAIHVTIGRIEVRAVQRPEKPAATPAPAAQPARSSLTDYLRRHGGSRE